MGEHARRAQTKSRATVRELGAQPHSCFADWLNPRRAKWFGETAEKTLAMDFDDAQYDKLTDQLAEENPECALGGEPLIAAAFDAYQECRRVPNKFRNLARPSEP